MQRMRVRASRFAHLELVLIVFIRARPCCRKCRSDRRAPAAGRGRTCGANRAKQVIEQTLATRFLNNIPYFNRQPSQMVCSSPRASWSLGNKQRDFYWRHLTLPIVTIVGRPCSWTPGSCRTRLRAARKHAHKSLGMSSSSKKSIMMTSRMLLSPFHRRGFKVNTAQRLPSDLGSKKGGGRICTLGRPQLAVDVLVLADVGAHAARRRARGEHVVGVTEALAAHREDGAGLGREDENDQRVFKGCIAEEDREGGNRYCTESKVSRTRHAVACRKSLREKEGSEVTGNA
eukprot:6213673-Pleurochrysis_carterae.AAC.3